MQQMLRRRRILIGTPVAVLIIAAFAAVFFTSYSCACSGTPELDKIQFAMDMMMVEHNLARVDANISGPAVNDWTGFPTGPGTVSLRDYLQKPTSEYYYCWTGVGEVFPRSDDDDIGREPGTCPPPP